MESSAKSGAPAADLTTLADPHLARIVAAWPNLSAAVKQRILALAAGYDLGAR
jgi:hypothetical protein